MARIQLRDTIIYLQDGLSGSGQVDIGNSALAVPAVVTDTEGETGVDEVQTIGQYYRAPTGGTYYLILDDGVDAACPVITAGIAWNAAAAVIEGAIDAAMTAAGYTAWANGDITVSETGTAGISDGDVTLTFDGNSVDEKDWEPTVINGAALTGVVVNAGLYLGLQSVSLNSTVADLVPVGARFTVAGEAGLPIHTVIGRDNLYDLDETMRVVLDVAIASALVDGTVITFLPQRLEIKIGDGDLSWTESREIIYDLDRDMLDTTRLGQEQALELDLAVIFEYVTTESGQEITPVDALKNIGEAEEWVSSSSDLCEPYAVDLYVIHCVPCGTAKDEDYLFQDFRWETLEFSMQDATITMSGRCNATSVIATRDNFDECA